MEQSYLQRLHKETSEEAYKKLFKLLPKEVITVLAYYNMQCFWKGENPSKFHSSLIYKDAAFRDMLIIQERNKQINRLYKQYKKNQEKIKSQWGSLPVFTESLQYTEIKTGGTVNE